MVNGFDHSELLGGFLDEVEEQLQLLDQDVLRLEQEGESPEVIQRIFRVAHTLKGSSATMGFEEMKKVTHEMESVLEKLRNQQMKVTCAVVNTLFRCLDLLRQLRDEYVQGNVQSRVEPLIKDLQRLLETNDSSTEVATPLVQPEADRLDSPWCLTSNQRTEIVAGKKKGLAAWVCEVELEDDCKMMQARALIILNRLTVVGSVIETSPKMDQVLDDNCFRKVTYLLVTDVTEADLTSKIQDFCDVLRVNVTPYMDVEEAQREPQREAEVSGEVISTPENKRLGTTMRVDVERVERIMNLVGELVIDQTRILRASHILTERYAVDDEVFELEEVANHLHRVISELQESVMRTRMLPIDQLFNRFPRMVRDLSQKLNKEVDLQMDGRETELDRTVIEEIGDPLIHLIRNSLDHGIEEDAIRLERGKPRKGTIRLSATHQDNQVVLTVADDGGGIHVDKVKQSAIDKGLITAADAETMTEEDLIHLIFHPGFSTASTVSDISGRGVGMDIVRSHIEKLNGLIDVETSYGEGTTFTIKLPLTLAILTGLLIQLNGRTYALPMSSVVEIMRMPEQDICSIKGQKVAMVRGRAIPLVWLHDHFGIPHSSEPRKNVFIVVVGTVDKRIGLVVDELIGNQEIVVKSIGSYVGKIDGISGATILGDGSVALILDVIGISKMLNTKKPLETVQ